jgi:hypothetical protein
MTSSSAEYTEGVAELEPRRRVYVSYSRDDEKLARELVRHLTVLEEEGLAEVLTERRITSAYEGPERLLAFLDRADIVLMLVSPAYLKGGQDVEVEMRRALERASAGQARILPVLLHDGPWRQTELAKYQFFPSDLRPIAGRRDRDKVLAELVDVMRDTIAAMPGQRMSPAVEEPVDGPGTIRGVSSSPPPDQAAREPDGDREPTGVEPERAPTVTQQTADAGLQLTPSVRRVRADLSGAVAAVSVVAKLLDAHPEYGGGAGRSLKLEDAMGDVSRHSADEWLTRVRTLFSTDTTPRLHGRLVIRGLALLEPQLTKRLLDHGFLAALEDELTPPLVDVLSPVGRRLWEPDEVPVQADRPARTDRLRRKGFTADLAGMIEEERRASEQQTGNPESFLVHLHGPWGSGKTSLLGFLADAMRDSTPRWVVVQFNAWQQERLSTPWWSLMTAVHHEACAWRSPERGPAASACAISGARCGCCGSTSGGACGSGGWRTSCSRWSSAHCGWVGGTDSSTPRPATRDG